MQRFWNQHAAVRLLVRFNQRDKQPRQCRAAAVEDVREFIFARFRFKPQIHPARLEILAVRAARHLEITPLPRRPHLEVVGLRARKAHVARAQQHHAVMQTQQLEHALRVRHHFLQLIVAVLRFHNLDQFNLVELMHANHAARADARRARLTAKTRRVGAIINWQLAFLENFLAMNVRHGCFGGRDQI